MAAKAFTIEETLKICQIKSKNTAITRLTPLRCMKPADDGQTYRVVPYEGGDYIAISYSWPGSDWIRLHDSNQPTIVQGHGATSPIECLHFSTFARKSVEDAIGSLNASVWLDYMCIDQSNNQEKAVQVALMDRFYNEAKQTVVLLEDVEISSDEFAFLQIDISHVADRTKEYVHLVRRILDARWFKRAWCSQEWVLSRSPLIFVHRSDNPSGSPVRFSWASLKHWISRAGIYDPTITALQLTDPRGKNSTGRYDFRNPVAWAFGIVHDLGCFNPYDKIALVNNLVRVEIASRIVDLPPVPSPGSDARMVALTLPTIRSKTPRASHGQARPSEGMGIYLKGVAMEVVEQVNWEFFRDDSSLHVTVDGMMQKVITSDWLDRYPTTRPLHVDQAFFRDLCYVIEAFNDETLGDLKSQMHTHFGYYLPRIMFFASRISFLWAENVGRFSLVTLADKTKRLVRGNVNDLRGKMLFQPYVIRPKELTAVVPTVNSLVLDLDDGGRKTSSPHCIGAVRGFGLLPEGECSELDAHIA